MAKVQSFAKPAEESDELLKHEPYCKSSHCSGLISLTDRHIGFQSQYSFSSYLLRETAVLKKFT